MGYSPCGCKELNMSKQLKHSTSEGRRVDGPTEEMQMAGSLPESCFISCLMKTSLATYVEKQVEQMPLKVLASGLLWNGQVPASE